MTVMLLWSFLHFMESIIELVSAIYALYCTVQWNRYKGRITNRKGRSRS